MQAPHSSSKGFSATQVEQSLKKNQPQCIVLYGCSLTEHGAWTKALEEWFNHRYPGLCHIHNTAGSGQNSDWALEHLATRVLKHAPDLIFIEFAYNDAHLKFELSPEEAKHNLNTIIETLKTQNPDITIVLQTMNVGWDAPNGNGSRSVRPHLARYYDVYRQCAQQHELCLLDHATRWQDLYESDLARFQACIPDGSHPSSEASLEYTWPLIRSWLEK